MLTINLQNLFNISDIHGLDESDLQVSDTDIQNLLNKFSRRGQGFLNLPFDQELLRDIKKYCFQIKGKYQNIVLLGIGGSALGPICLQQSLTHLFSKNEGPELYVLDNIDPILIKELEEVIDYSETLFIVTSKSGTTPETVSQYLYFRDQVEKSDLDVKNHFVFITDPVKGFLRKIAEEEDIQTFPIPDDVGGRFSVLTAVGLLPAELIGLDTEELLRGAAEMVDIYNSSDPKKNRCWQLARVQYLLDQKGKSMTVIWPYTQKLIRLADWYRQLLAESIGKKFNDQGELVNIGLTPINALGVTDQHSQSQLYNEGPNDKLFIFIKLQNYGIEINIPDSKEIDYLKKITFNKLITTEQVGTALALNQNNRPNITIAIEQVDAYNLGQLLMLFQGSIAFLGEMYGVNAFDQPGVELSKNLTRELLL